MDTESRSRYTLWIIIAVILLSFGSLLYLAKQQPYFGKHKKHMRFAITSYGHTGTTWLATILNMHPQIVCVHRLSDPYDDSVYHLSSLYKPVKGVAGYYDWISRWGTKDTKAVGNVHGLRLKWLLDEAILAEHFSNQQAQIFGDLYLDADDKFDQHYRKIIKINQNPDHNMIYVNMIRHPITRIESCYVYWTKKVHRMYGLIGQVGYHKLFDMLELMMVYGVPIDSEKKLVFLLAMVEEQLAYADMYDAIKLGIPQVRYEDIIVNPQALEDLIIYISAGKIKPSKQEVLDMIQTAPINVGNRKHVTPAEIYASWEDWQKLAFYLHIIRNGSFANNVYNDLGYDLSFIKEEDFSKYKIHKMMQNDTKVNMSDDELFMQVMANGDLIKYHSLLLMGRVNVNKLKSNPNFASNWQFLAQGQGRFVFNRMQELIQS